MKNAFIIKICFLAVVTVFLLNLFSTNAQQTLNFSFEKLSIEGTQRPWGWSVASFTAGGKVIVDSTVKRSGKYSLRISDNNNDPASSNYYSLRYLIEPYSLRTKILKIKGLIKTGDLKGNLKIALESYKGLGILTDSAYKIIKNNTGNNWTAFEIELKVSAPVHSVYLTLGLSGSGTVWLDDIDCFVNNKKIEVAEASANMNPIQFHELSKYVYPFKSINGSKENEDQDFSDLLPFKKIVGDAKIVALGESTHGTGDFFKMKHRLLEYSVKEMGFSVFALEANQLNVERINNYVHTGIGDLKKLMARSLFAVWNTEEVLDLINWVRSYNNQNPSKQIDFVGYDMQEPSLPIDSLNNFLADYDIGLKAAVDALLLDLNIGGADGFLSALIALHHPQIKCTTFDLPPVAPLALAKLKQMNVSDRVSVASGDFVKDVLPSAEIISMGNILHGLNEEAKIELMKKAFDVLPANGVLIAIENVIDNNRIKNTFGLLMSLDMLIEIGDGFDYTQQDFENWAKQVGFKRTEFIPLAGFTSAAVAYKS